MKTNLFLVSELTVLLNKQSDFLLRTPDNAMDGVSLFILAARRLGPIC